ncbi:MAG: hypothetical protein IPH05_03540 [Flavobacteriales bacterium]|nr:hypothetical protein [Flavobacteriales bacterium]
MLDEQLLELPVDLRNLITAEQAWHYRIIPKARTEGGIVFHAPSDARTRLRNELEVVLGQVWA